MDPPQNGIDEPRCGAFVGAFYQVDGIGHGGMRWNAIEMAKLVDSYAQRDADFDIQLLAPAGEILDEEIELRAIAKNAKDDLRREPGITRIEPLGVRQQQFGSPSSAFHASQNVEG